ncbi:MAG: peptidoglycan-associated lipoprotein [Nitratiruptor sp.]|nr:peptidoglycan-associated lipoprotein [Nitratiruptor sp.]NPA83995.1 OmpA family protein [Campylobacterota bacterium]
MKQILTTIFLLLFLLSGCAKKSVEIEMPPSASTGPQVESEVQEGSGIHPLEGGIEELDEEQKLALMRQIESQAKVIYFDFDQYTIRPDQMPKIEYNAKLFNQPQARPFRIKVEGNCDEWGSDEYNYALGLKRAKSVRDALVAKGVAPERLSIISYGESNPVCREHTRECWAKNRRVEFELIP